MADFRRELFVKAARAHDYVRSERDGSLALGLQGGDAIDEAEAIVRHGEWRDAVGRFVAR